MGLRTLVLSMCILSNYAATIMFVRLTICRLSEISHWVTSVGYLDMSYVSLIVNVVSVVVRVVVVSLSHCPVGRSRGLGMAGHRARSVDLPSARRGGVWTCWEG